MSRPTIIVGEIRSWEWLDGRKRVRGEMYLHELMFDGANIIVDVAYLNEKEDCWIVKTPGNNQGEAYKMFKYTEKVKKS